MAAPIPQLDVHMNDLRRLVERTRQTSLTDDEYTTLKAAIETLGYVADLLEQKGTTVANLRQLLFGASTEKTRDVLAQAGVVDAMGTDGPRDDESSADADRPRRDRARGHGRHGAEAYAGARRIDVAHPQLHHGDRCPHCAKGKLYVQREPGLLIRFLGQAPITATVYALEKLRCNLCGEVFTADPPPGVGVEKYDATAGAMIAVLKYGTGMPFHRLERLQANLQIPLPASTQWEIVADLATRLQPVLRELTQQAAQGEILHNDDTSMTVLSLGGRGLPRGDPEADEVSPDRTGVFTSAVVSTREGQRIALFLTGRRHAGENLARILAARAVDLGPPIQMCDALTRNLPKPLTVILGNCLAHARRHVVNVTPNFPEEGRYILEDLRDVYRYDAEARQRGLSPMDRLAFHQAHSGPLMDQLHAWLTTQLEEHRVEPNSGLGHAITYFLKHWAPLTLFLRQPGAPLDNNIVERSLKRAILHRKNSYFYRTSNGAHVGDLFMSLIHTCELAGANAFDYLTALQRHADALKQNPTAWMPWNYQESAATVETATATR
jgi:transposase